MHDKCACLGPSSFLLSVHIGRESWSVCLKLEMYTSPSTHKLDGDPHILRCRIWVEMWISCAQRHTPPPPNPPFLSERSTEVLTGRYAPSGLTYIGDTMHATQTGLCQRRVTGFQAHRQLTDPEWDVWFRPEVKVLPLVVVDGGVAFCIFRQRVTGLLFVVIMCGCAHTDTDADGRSSHAP